MEEGISSINLGALHCARLAQRFSLPLFSIGVSSTSTHGQQSADTDPHSARDGIEHRHCICEAEILQNLSMGDYGVTSG